MGEHQAAKRKLDFGDDDIDDPLPTKTQKITRRDVKRAILACVRKYGITPKECQREPELAPFVDFIFDNTRLYRDWCNEVAEFIANQDAGHKLSFYLNRPDSYRWGVRIGTLMTLDSSIQVLEYIIGNMTGENYALLGRNDCLVSDLVKPDTPEWTMMQEKLQVLVDVFDMVAPVNTILFFGAPKTGKTTICQLMKNIVGYNFAADLNRMDERGGNTFAFSNLTNKRVIIAEEFATGTDETKLEKLKMLLGGTPIQTNLKMENEGGLIHRSPVFMTANQYPLHANHENVHGEAFRRRIINFCFDSINKEYLESLCTHSCLNPFALRFLLQKYNVEY